MSKTKSALFKTAKGGWLAKRQHKKQRTMAVKKKTTRKVRQAGEPLPDMIPSDRVLRALEIWEIKPKDFIRAYDESASPRGRAAQPLSAAERKVVVDYHAGKLTEEDAMSKLDIKTPSAFLNALKKHREETA